MRSDFLRAAFLISVIFAATMLISTVASSVVNFQTISSSGAIRYGVSLHVDGRYIKDSLNNTVILKGVNTGGLGDAPDGVWSGVGMNTYADWQSGQSYVTSQLDAIKSWGCNIIRVMYRASWWLNNVGNERQMLKDLATLLAQRGMYMIIEGYYVSGTNYSPYPYPPFQSDAGDPQTIPDTNAYINLMVSISNTFKTYGNVLIGMWNEAGNGVESNDTATSEWFSVTQKVLNQVRGNGSQNIVLVQWSAATWVNLQSPPPNPPAASESGTLQWIYQYPLNGSNIVYQTHYYDGFQYPSGVGNGVGYGGLSYAQVMEGLTYAWVPYVLNTMHKPLLFGEIGANLWWSGSDLKDELRSFNNTLAALNSLGIGYVGWEWRVGTKYALITSNGPSYTPSDSGIILKNAT